MTSERTYGGHTAKQLSALWEAAPGEPTDYDGYTKPAASDLYNALLGSLPDLLATVETQERLVQERDTYKAMLVQIADYCDDGDNWPHGMDGDDTGSWITCDGRFSVQQMAQEAVEDYKAAAKAFAHLEAVWAAARRYRWEAEREKQSEERIAAARAALFAVLTQEGGADGDQSR